MPFEGHPFTKHSNGAKREEFGDGACYRMRSDHLLKGSAELLDRDRRTDASASLRPMKSIQENWSV